MTLVLGIVSDQGAWISVDHRLTPPGGGVPLSDNCTKHTVIKCTGGAAIIAFIGLGRTEGGIELSRWLRQILRGETRSLDETFAEIRTQATGRIGMLARANKVPTFFVAAAYINDVPWAVEVRNVRNQDDVDSGMISGTFATYGRPVVNGAVILTGSGAVAVSEEDRGRLVRLSMSRPRRVEEYMNVLAGVHQRTVQDSRAAATVSRACSVVYMPRSGAPVKHEWFGPEEDRHLVPEGVPYLLLGVDVNEIAMSALKDFWPTVDGRMTEDEARQSTADSGHRAVRPTGRRRLT